MGPGNPRELQRSCGTSRVEFSARSSDSACRHPALLPRRGCGHGRSQGGIPTRLCPLPPFSRETSGGERDARQSPRGATDALSERSATRNRTEARGRRVTRNADSYRKPRRRRNLNPGQRLTNAPACEVPSRRAAGPRSLGHRGNSCRSFCAVGGVRPAGIGPVRFDGGERYLELLVQVIRDRSTIG